MKIKILIFPLALAISVVLAISYVWPEYQNLKQAKNELEESKTVLKNVLEKKRNIENQEASLRENAAKAEFVRKFLPQKRSEERIIDAYNYISAASQVALISVSFEEAPKPAASPEKTQSSKEALFTAADEASLADLVRETEVVPQKIKVKSNVLGGYEKIKLFLDQLYRIEMFSTLSNFTVSIQPQDKKEGEEASPADTLLASAEVEFSYLPEIRVSADYSSPVFSKPVIDFAPCDQLKDFIASDVPDIQVGEQGRGNPFLP